VAVAARAEVAGTSPSHFRRLTAEKIGSVQFSVWGASSWARSVSVQRAKGRSRHQPERAIFQPLVSGPLGVVLAFLIILRSKPRDYSPRAAGIRCIQGAVSGALGKGFLASGAAAAVSLRYALPKGLRINVWCKVFRRILKEFS